jgi:hypothetical protein
MIRRAMTISLKIIFLCLLGSIPFRRAKKRGTFPMESIKIKSERDSE